MCGGGCGECPRRRHRPQTAEGAAVWALVPRLGGQWRYAQLDMGVVRTGYDMCAVLKVAEAAGLSAAAVVELMPVIEAAAIRADRKDG